MSERFQFPLETNPDVFDRLVDGELSAAEERALLGAIDAQTDGWRRCALAFLESRAWKSELDMLVCGQPTRHNGVPVHLASPCATGSASAVVPSSLSSPPRPAWLGAVALAASIALAFFLGIVVRGWKLDDLRVQGGIAEGFSSGVSSKGNLAREEDHRSPSDAPFEAAYDIPSTVTMTLVNNRGDIERQFEVPLVETDQFNPRWLQSHPSAMSEQEVEALRRSGYRVDQERLYVPVVLDDGRQAIVPLDQAQVKYAGMQF